MALNPKWNMISRSIVPIMAQTKVVGTGSQGGLGDIVQSVFFSPNKTKPLIWGLGPVFLIPTATSSSLCTGKFGLGPTLVALKQNSGWTYGGLFNHIWSVAGSSTRSDVNSTFMQPFVSYTTKTAWTMTLNTESTYDWTAGQLAAPINFSVSKLMRFGKRPVSIDAGPKCWATSPAGAASGCGLRFSITPLFPKK